MKSPWRQIISELKLLLMQEAYSAHSPKFYRLCTSSSIEKLREVKLGEYSVLEQKSDWFPSEVDAKHANQDKLLHKNAQERGYIK